MAFFDIGNRRKQQEGRRNAGVMGQGLGRGLQMLQQGQRPGGMGADYREKLARMREMQGQREQYRAGGMSQRIMPVENDYEAMPGEPAQMPAAGLGGLAAPAPQQNQQYSQADMMRKQAMYRQQQEQRGAEAIARNRAAVGPVGALGSREDILRAAQERGVAGPMGRMAYDQPRMNPYTQRQRALAAMQQRAAQPRQRGNTSAGVFRKMMLERARKRQMRDQRMQRNRFNPLMNR